MIPDAMKGAIWALVRAALPTFDYAKFYPATVVAQSGDRKTVDVEPDDDDMPSMTKVELQTGIAGVTVKISGGHRVLVGWKRADPRYPIACLHPGDGMPADVVSINAAKVELGGEGLRPLLEQVVIGATKCQFSGAPHAALGPLSSIGYAKE